MNFPRIDENNPVCLYCKSSYFKALHELNDDLETFEFKCLSCNERFYKHIFKSIIIYMFSCYDFLVSEQLDDKISITKIIKNDLNHNITSEITIPKFDIDLSNKEEIYSKFKLYTTFS
jgi:hypothetical protein